MGIFSSKKQNNENMIELKNEINIIESYKDKENKRKIQYIKKEFSSILNRLENYEFNIDTIIIKSKNNKYYSDNCIISIDNFIKYGINSICNEFYMCSYHCDRYCEQKLKTSKYLYIQKEKDLKFKKDYTIFRKFLNCYYKYTHTLLYTDIYCKNKRHYSYDSNIVFKLNLKFLDHIRTKESKNLFIKLYLKWCIKCQNNHPIYLARALKTLYINYDINELFKFIFAINLSYTDAICAYIGIVYFIIDNIVDKSYDEAFYLLTFINFSKIFFLIYNYITKEQFNYITPIEIYNYSRIMYSKYAYHFIFNSDFYKNYNFYIQEISIIDKLHATIKQILTTKDRISLYFSKYNDINFDRLCWMIAVYKSTII